MKIRLKSGKWIDADYKTLDKLHKEGKESPETLRDWFLSMRRVERRKAIKAAQSEPVRVQSSVSEQMKPEEASEEVKEQVNIRTDKYDDSSAMNIIKKAKRGRKPKGE